MFPRRSKIEFYTFVAHLVCLEAIHNVGALDCYRTCRLYLLLFGVR